MAAATAQKFSDKAPQKFSEKEEAQRSELFKDDGEQKPSDLLSLIADVDDDADVEDIDLANLDITNEEIDFNELDELIDKFQQDERVKQALLQGVDMRDYGRQIDSSLKEEEADAVGDYLAVTEDLIRLHNEITSCDEILSHMETLLSGFQSDLGNISTEIKTLQDQSSSLSVQLKNRKQVGDLVSGYIHHVAVSPKLASSIEREEVSEAYIEYVRVLNKKMQYLQQHKKKNDNIASLKDIEPRLKKLRDIATLKIRKFLLQKIAQLQRPKTNTNVIQQNVLLKYKLLHSFLRKNDQLKAEEVRKVYIDTMSDIYLTNGRAYVGNLMRLHKVVGQKTDLLGAPEDSGKGWFSFRFDAERPCIFTLNNRHDVVKNLQAPPVIPHEVVKRGETLRYEELFRSMNYYLIDLVTAEYNFCVEFFGRNTDTFVPVFKELIRFYVENVKEYLAGSFDCIGILLVIKLARGIQQIMLARRVSALQSYFQTIANFLWPRFLQLFSMHLTSVRQVTPEALGEKVDTRPHFIVRRYAEFVSAIRVIDVQYADNRLNTNMSALGNEMEKLLQTLQGRVKEPKMRSVLVINNLDLILSLLETYDVQSEEKERFSAAKEKQVDRFVQQELATYLEPLLSFVSTCKTQQEIEHAHPAQAGKIVTHFANNWKSIIEAINRDVMTAYFSNFKNGAAILKKVLTELVLCYTRFGDILKQKFKQSPIMKDFVPPTTVTYEVQKYSVEF